MRCTEQKLTSVALNHCNDLKLQFANETKWYAILCTVGRCCRSVLWTMASSDQGDVMLMLGGGLVANAIQMQALLLQVNSVVVLFQMQSVGLSLYLNLLCCRCCWSTKQIQSCGSVWYINHESWIMINLRAKMGHSVRFAYRGGLMYTQKARDNCFSCQGTYLLHCSIAL